MFQKNIQILFFLSLILNSLFSIGQNADCTNLLELTDTIYLAKNVNGYGSKREFSGNDLQNKLVFEQEENSVWYLIKAPASGKFTFDIIAKNENDDWDFLLYEYKNMFCKRIDSNKIKPIRSNLSRSAITGLSLASTQSYIGAGLNDNFSKYVEVKKGDEFVLVVNNPKKANSTHKLVLHFPKEVDKPVEQVIPVVDLNLKKFKLQIKDKVTKQALSANVNIIGLKKEAIELKDLTVYETEVSKKNYKVNVIVFAKGFMLTSVDVKLFKNRSSQDEVLYIERIEEGKKVNLKNIQFYGERADFLPSASGALKSLLNFMKMNSTIIIEIEGHVNGPGQSNTKSFKTLSFSRASAVKQFLVENGIDDKRIRYVGYGNSQMLYPYPMKEDEHSANRRVEIKIIGK